MRRSSRSSPTWGIGARLDFRGANLEEFASFNDLHFLGPPVDSTWSNGPLSSSIDVTLASSSLAIHVTRGLLDEMAFTDHIPIWTTFLDMVNNETKSSWVESSCKEQTFKSFINSSLHQLDGASAWGGRALSSEGIRQLRSLHYNFAKRVLRGGPYTPTVSAISITGSPPFDIIVRSRTAFLKEINEGNFESRPGPASLSGPVRSTLVAKIILVLNTNQNVNLCWVPGHCGIDGKERADRAAKNAAVLILEPSFSILPRSLARNHSRAAALDAWTEVYCHDHYNRHLRRIAHTPDRLLQFLPKVCPGEVTTTLLTGHGPVRADLVLWRPGEDPSCPHCMEEQQTVDHLLFRCPAFMQHRMKTALLLGKTSFDPVSLAGLPESSTEALRAFRNFKGIRRGKGPISCYSLRRMIKKIEKTGSLEAKPRSGRPSTRKSVAVTVSQNVEAIETLSTYGERLAPGFHRRVKAKTFFQDDDVPIDDDTTTKPFFTPQENGRKGTRDKIPRLRWNPWQKHVKSICNVTLNMSNSTSPESPGSAGQKPGRPSILTPTGSENSAKNEFHGEIYGEKSNSREYVNPPADGGNVNLAAARVDVTSGMAAASSSNGAALTIRNWADCDEVMNPGTDDDFTVVKNKKRRRESSDSPTAATPSSNSGGARSGRRVQSSARSVPRAQEIPTTRAHIAEARARQTSSAEEHCVYLEHGSELQPFHYLRALDRLLGGTAGVVQVSKVNGHQLLGLANRGLAELLINNGLEVEGTLLRAFPFRKRAERITVGNLPFFVEDSAIIKALGPYGRITSIAPKMMKAGPYTYTDGRREAFIVLHEGVTTERLPTRLNITIKGEAWPAYLSSGIKCSRCHGQGHRRANCPLLAGRVNTTRSAPPASPAGLPPTTTPAPAQRPTPQHSAPAPPLEISGASPAPRAAIHPAGAPRPSPTAPSASPTEETPPAPPPVTPDPSSQAPSDPASQEILGPANIAQDIEMTAVEESIPPSASSNKKCTRIDLAAFIKRSPSVSFAGTDALGLGREEVLDLLSSRTKAHKRGRHLTPPQSNALAGLVNQILNLRPGGDSNSTIYKVLRQVLSELRTGTAAVPPATTLPAPRPAEPAPPAPQKRESTPAMATPPPPPSAQMEVDPIDKRCKELQLLTFELMKEFNPKPMSQFISFELDLVEAVLYPEDREDFLGRFSPGDKKVLAQILDKLSTRDLDSLTLRGLSELRAALPSGNTPSLARAESPSKAEEKPARLGSKAQPSAELPARNALKFNSSMKSTKNQRYANPATGGKDANPAAPTDFAAASSSEAAAQAHRNWAELSEDSNSEYEGNFTIVQKRKRRRGSANSSPAAAPSSNLGGARTNRRPQSSAGWAPRAQEVRTTRAHIVEARARQASSTEDHCVYVERSPELEPYHYKRAMDRMFGSTREVFQVTKMNGHFLVGLANRGMAERLVNEGLEVEGTLHRVFPFRKRAERITVGNLPFFLGDAAVISALTPLGRVTSIAPKLMKAGPYTYNDGRREAFIILREGMTIEGLPTRLNITIKGEAWPAYLSSGIRCSRCRGQGHRRANCPLLAGRTNAPGPATPTSPTSVPSASAPGLPQQPSAQPPPPASPSPAMEVSEVPSTSRAALPPAAPRQSPPVAPAIPTEMAPPAPPPVAPAPSLRAPGSHGPAVPTLDVEMSIEETSTFRAALKTSPAAVPPTPPLPAPQPAGPIPPAPDEEEMTPIMREECMVIEILKKLKHLTCLRPLYQSGIQPNDLKDAILFIDERESLMARLTPAMRGVLAEFLSAAIEPARGKHPDKTINYFQLSKLSHTHTHTLGRAARICRAPPFSHPGGCMATGGTPSLARAESPLKADQMPGRHGLKAHLCAEKSAIFESQSNYSNNQEAFDKYANLPAGGKDVNLAAPFNLAANPSSNAVAQAQRNWADMTEDINPEIEDNFTLVQRRKRRRGSGNSPTSNAPSSNVGGSRTDRRPRSSTGWAPRAEEIRTTRAHIAEARAQQASSSEEYCVYIERSPDLEPFHYLRALDRMVGGTSGVVQVSKVNGLYLLGLTNRGLVERLISEGLEVEGTLLKAFPFRKRAERITVGNLPFFVADCVIINALSTFGRVTSIAPKLMKAGPYIYNDGRREAFIALHEGVTIERLPTRLEIKIKGETWPAYLTSGIRCSRCHGQGHRRAICPLLAGLANNTRMAPPTTPAGVPPPTTPAPPQRSAAQPPAPASSDPASETPGAPPEARAVTTSTAPRPSPPVAPAVSMEKAPSAPPPVTPAPSLQAPEGPVGPRPANSQHPEPPPARPDFVAPRGPLPAQKTLGPAAPTPDVEMSTTEEPSAPSPAAVSAPPLPAPQPAGPTPSAPHKEDPTPAMTPPSLPPTPMEEDLPPNLGDCIDEILREIIMSKINPGPLVDDETSWTDAIDAILHPHSRAPFLARLSPILKKNYAVFFEAAIERARDSHPRILS
ncbi:hypothetical protein LAZ67_4001886, partial [Cordylochernes scorpioides]